MEVEHANPSTYHDDADQTGDDDRGNWHRRLRLRKSSASSLTVKNPTEEERVIPEPPKELPSEPPQNEDLPHKTLNSSSGKLTFTCSNCKDGTAFSPQGLLDHFTVFHGGKGDPPTFQCDMCKFATPEFTVLQQHRLKHRQCKLTCEICNDSVLQTLSQLKKHCKTQHSLDGKYHCEKCKFSAKELKIFVFHSCPASTESPVDSTENNSDIRHMNGELNRNHVAAAGWMPQKEELLKHKAADCCQGWRNKTWRRKKEVPSEHDSVSTPDLLPKPPETQWNSSEFLHFSAAGFLDENDVLLNPAKTLEETQQFLERTVNRGKKWAVPLKGDPEIAPQSYTLGPLPPQPKTIATKQYSIPVPGLKNYVKNKLSGLMEKNNISVPPDCTTKVVGFKMVDGKKHLILRVIPSAKPDVCPDTGEVSPGLETAEFNGIESGSQVERPGDQTCAELFTGKSFNATSISGQSEIVNEKQVMEKNPTEDAPQVDNTENDYNNDSCALTEPSNEPPQLAVSGTMEDFNVANQNNTDQQLLSPDVVSDSNSTHQLSDAGANVAVEESSLREVDIQTLNTNKHSVEHTKTTLTDFKEKALDDLKENRPELTTSHNDSRCREDFAGSILSDLASLKESQLSALISGEDGSPHVDSNKKKSGEEAQVMSSSLLLHSNEQIMETAQSSASASPCSPDNQAIFELNSSNPAFVSLHKHTTEPLFNSLSEDVGLLFQDSGDEYTNSLDSRDAPVPLDQSCTSETVEEPNYLALAVTLLGDSCHNPDLYQTLEELPVTTVNHLLDDPEVTSRGITNQLSGLGLLSTQQAGLQSPKAIPVAEKDSTQSNLCLSPANEPAMKRRRQGEPLTKDLQQHIPKARKQMARRSQENNPPASIPYWEPVPQTVERTLRLLPVYSSQPIKIPHLNQPVIVLNHPDTDIPEVANIMRIVNKHRGAVRKVILSKGTLKALSELNCDTFRKSLGADCHSSHCRRVWPQGTVRERFILKLKLKRLCGHKYKVTPSAPKANGYQSTFRCWFCGRLFRNQEAWVGHGQRHLMEATRDWNKLFSCNGHHNSPIEPYFH
uniref:Zinc finger protein 518A n=1 Tax=Astyanax mexicanus TaxID=7994 RepID=W5L4W9_ASTMX